ncbi:MAG: hypothetical protein LUC29_00220 [Acidaminococcaceae bacterium]|nr:hypothetical protein [Acidaminococcaceae bacterium]
MVKKVILYLVTMMLFLGMATAFAAENADAPMTMKEKMEKIRLESDPIYVAEKAKRMKNMPKVAVLYVNNAETTYNDEVDAMVLGNLEKCISDDKYIYINGDPYIERLNKVGIVDITTAERADIIDAFEGEDVDYVVFVEVQPFIARDKITFFTVGKDITTTVSLKIIDLVNGKYLYNGKFTEKASDSTMIGGIGNKSVAMKALKKIDEQIASVLAARLPEEKPVLAAAAK